MLVELLVEVELPQHEPSSTAVMLSTKEVSIVSIGWASVIIPVSWLMVNLFTWGRFAGGINSKNVICYDFAANSFLCQWNLDTLCFKLMETNLHSILIKSLVNISNTRENKYNRKRKDEQLQVYGWHKNRKGILIIKPPKWRKEKLKESKANIDKTYT